MLSFMSPTLRRGLVLGLVILAVITLGAKLRTSLGIDLDVESVHAFAESLGPLGPILFIGIVALRSVLALPSQIVLIAAGLCFGTVIGTLVGATGLMLSGLAIFLGVRYAGREAVEERLGPRFSQVLNAAGHRGGAVALALGSGYPISPLSPIHAAAGLTPMAIGVFVLAAFCGGLLRASIFSYFGNAITDWNQAAFVYSAIGMLLILTIPFCFASGRIWFASLFVFDRPEHAPATDVDSASR